MCLKVKTLNPHAKEWKPTPKHPHPPPPPPPYYPKPLLFIHCYNVATHCRPLRFSPAPRFSKMMKGPRVKSPKCPPAANPAVSAKQGSLINTRPARPRRLRRSDPPPRQEWRPKLAPPADCVISGAGHIPPPRLSGRRRSGPAKTTVMIKNIPNHLRRHFMLNFLDDHCRTYSLEYDFLYLPMDFRKGDNLGYAFVNFTTCCAAQKFKRILHNYKWSTFYYHGRTLTSPKVCHIAWARIQGLDALFNKFRNSSFECDRLDYLPVILNPPRNGRDPNPYPPVVLGSLHQH